MNPKLSHYIARLSGTRPDWPDNMTDKERKIMSDHYNYLKDLAAKNKVVLAGPCIGLFGLVILQTESEDEAKAIMDNEPSITGGAHTYEISPMNVSIMADFRPRDRYVDDPSSRILRKEISVKASIDEAWETWTTTKGVNRFFSDNALVELYPGGPFEIYFNSEAKYGTKGSEDCKILSFLPKEYLCFEWNAPPDFGDIRYVKTQVMLRFEETPRDGVRLIFTQYGWGKTDKWNELYDYFDRAWSMVLDNFKNALEE
jgi:uncharacterized protein YndB with AHSA1/START domain/uncharacterized protein YciI